MSKIREIPQSSFPLPFSWPPPLACSPAIPVPPTSGKAELGFDPQPVAEFRSSCLEPGGRGSGMLGLRPGPPQTEPALNSGNVCAAGAH